MEKVTVFVCLLVLGVQDVIPYPSHEWRFARSPYSQNTFMLSSLNPPSSYVPDNFMTSFGGGEAIATNTYGGTETFDNEEDVITEVKNPEPQIDQKPIAEDSIITEIPLLPKKKPSDKPEPEEDENDPWPFYKDTRRGYNAFFPIVIGGYPDGRGVARNSGEYPSGSATAIANSFSTGRGGVASSHATSFGDPYLSMLLRNALFKRKSLLSEKDE
ncbi:hypothetical protein Trydic_g13371 [Trypoxylus dichotomus]